uniref:Uncharacterized protein n=1 Tax=Poecilia reticulata TaxID=8081 RepID=A0A3P9Q7N3_POERE
MLDDQHRQEMGRRAMELQNLEMAKRKADLIDDANYNAAKVRSEGNIVCLCYEVALCCWKTRPGPLTSRGASVLQRLERERNQWEEEQDRLLLNSARSALLLERLQEKQNKQLRKHMDSVNAQLAQIQLQESVAGRIDDSFFAQFHTCTR